MSLHEREGFLPNTKFKYRAGKRRLPLWIRQGSESSLDQRKRQRRAGYGFSAEVRKPVALPNRVLYLVAKEQVVSPVDYVPGNRSYSRRFTMSPTSLY
ncbi:hypothetical protein L3X38_000212 (mitochondrion) [Prunus dulcis]|uniref:Uncharacterized protein n=1 Tax=Prunus dulcis TaxID=3755 RepID=A0AAD4USV0_PRUDU|nr:hypothetical protein L3X38_000212 [Prunus dulcis]